MIIPKEVVESILLDFLKWVPSAPNSVVFDDDDKSFVRYYIQSQEVTYEDGQ